MLTRETERYTTLLKPLLFTIFKFDMCNPRERHFPPNVYKPFSCQRHLPNPGPWSAFFCQYVAASECVPNLIENLHQAPHPSRRHRRAWTDLHKNTTIISHKSNVRHSTSQRLSINARRRFFLLLNNFWIKWCSSPRNIICTWIRWEYGSCAKQHTALLKILDWRHDDGCY